MERVRLLLLILCFPLFGFTCAYHVRDFSVAPSYEEINRNDFSLEILVEDYRQVVAALKDWSKETQFSEGHCPRYAKSYSFGNSTPAIYYLCRENITIEARMSPGDNSTSILMFDPRNSSKELDEVMRELKPFMESKFGASAVFDYVFR